MPTAQSSGGRSMTPTLLPGRAWKWAMALGSTGWREDCWALSNGTVAKLKAEIDSLRESNRWLDGQVTTLREQRDRALFDAPIGTLS